MAADDPIIVSRSNQQERDSLEAVERALRPCRCTWVDTKDDFGRDGLVQVNVPIEGCQDARATSLTFILQVRSHRAPLAAPHTERVETRHLALWSASSAHCTVLAVWSADSGEIRWRTARDIENEVSKLRPGWRNQDTVGVALRQEHRFDGVEKLLRRVADESDRDGGVTTFHSSRRRVLLTGIFTDRVPTLSFVNAANDKGPFTVLIGPGWDAGDLDAADIDGLGTLAGAAFLYEEVWLPMSLASVTVHLLGHRVFTELVRNDRLVLYTLPAYLGFAHRPSGDYGEVISIAPGNETFEDHLKSWSKRVARERGGGVELASVVLQAARVVAADRTDGILNTTSADLKRSEIRDLIGIAACSERVPVWDGVLANRVLHVNAAMAIADAERIDVVEYEAGLSRVATEKFYSDMSFDRLYESSAALDAVLRSVGLPDAGQLVKRIGADEFFNAAQSTAAQDFRDWFWSCAAPIAGSGGDIRTRFEQMIHGVLPIEEGMLRLVRQLRLRYCQQLGDSFVLGAPLRVPSASFGFATRGHEGRESLRHQERRHQARRLAAIENCLGRKPSPYEQCPCGSSEKFKFCCGRA